MSLYEDEKLKCNIGLIVLIRNNIYDIRINVNEKYLLYNINIDKNMMSS